MKRGILLILAVLCFSSAPRAEGSDAAPAAQGGEITSDMFPETSRSMHRFNMRVMHAVKPDIENYRRAHSPAIHRGIGNFIRNLREPLTFVNAMLQLDLEAAQRAIFRFAVNSTIGLGGAMDIAADMNVKRDKRDFGQTLGSWGVSMGGFFVLPLCAQSNTRDFSGGLIDSYLLDPMDFVLGYPIALFLGLSSAFMGVYDGYDFIIATDEAAIDSYATFKTMYLQNRKEQVDNTHTSFYGGEDDAQKTSAYDFDME